MADTIKCSLYDYFEIACMRRSQVSLELHTGESLSGIATELSTRGGKEFLVLSADDTVHEINLMDINVLVFVKSAERIRFS